MTRFGWAKRTALLGLVATGLSGCVAVAAIPAIAGGVAAKKAGDYAATTRARKRACGEQQLRGLPASTAASGSGSARITTATTLPPPDSAHASAAQVPATQTQASAAPLPTDLSTMRPGVAYAGALPSPYKAPAASASSPATAQRPRWTDVGRYVAALPASIDNSVLLARGSTSEAPAWVPCTGPRAVLVRLEAALTQDGGRWRFDREARQWLGAFQTLEIPVVFTSLTAATARPGIEAAFRDAGLAKLLSLGDMRLGLTAGAMPAERAAIAAQRCAVALVGRDASDFPNGLLPDTSPRALRSTWGAGWFRVSDD